jgi:hypothetical protein
MIDTVLKTTVPPNDAQTKAQMRAASGENPSVTRNTGKNGR